MENIKIVDFCSYFGEKELLEARINYLYDYVDKFIISEIVNPNLESQLEFSNIDDSLNKIQIIRMNLFSILDTDKERIQRDALLSVLHRFDEETIFIVSDDCEVIDRTIIDYYLRNIQKLPEKILRIPMVFLGNETTLRVCDDYQNDIAWNCPFMCNKSKFDNLTPSKIRDSIVQKTKETSNLDIFIVDNGVNQDAGWNFKLVGKNIDHLNYKFKAYTNFVPFIYN